MKTEQNIALVYDELIQLSKLVDQFTNPSIFERCIRVEENDLRKFEDKDWIGQDIYQHYKFTFRIDDFIAFKGGNLIISKPIRNKFKALENKWTKFITEYWEESVKYHEFILLNKTVLFWEKYLELDELVEPENKNVHSNTPPKEENTEQKIRRVLAPLSQNGSQGIVILSNNHFEVLVKAYLNYIEDNKIQNVESRITFHSTNKEFYSVLSALHKELSVRVKGIGKVLTEILYANNGSYHPINSNTIEKNIFNYKPK